MNMLRAFTSGILISSALVASAAADEMPKKLTIATWNLEWFFDQYTGDNSADLAKKQAAPVSSQPQAAAWWMWVAREGMGRVWRRWAWK